MEFLKGKMNTLSINSLKTNKTFFHPTVWEEDPEMKILSPYQIRYHKYLSQSVPILMLQRHTDQWFSHTDRRKPSVSGNAAGPHGQQVVRCMKLEQTKMQPGGWTPSYNAEYKNQSEPWLPQRTILLQAL